MFAEDHRNWTVETWSMFSELNFQVAQHLVVLWLDRLGDTEPTGVRTVKYDLGLLQQHWNCVDSFLRRVREPRLSNKNIYFLLVTMLPNSGLFFIQNNNTPCYTTTGLNAWLEDQDAVSTILT